jgi:SPP1 gp7 family putative phage head morphogenesis protein
MADPVGALTIGQLVEQYQAGVLARDAEAMARIIEAYGRIYRLLSAEIDALLAEIAAARAAGTVVTAAQVCKMARFRRVIADVTAELAKFGAVLENEVLLAQMAAAQMAAQGAPAFVQGMFSGMPEAVQASIMATFGVLPGDAVEALVGALQEGTPLSSLLAGYGAEAAQGISSALLAGIAKGTGPREIAREIRKLFGVPLSDALRISRTEIMRAFRAAALASYRANAHIVNGWIWFAALDERTCMACVAMHGTTHTLDETLDDHPNGRCVMVPSTVTPGELGIDAPDAAIRVESGEGWFLAQPEATQKAMMGPGLYEAWRQGLFTFEELATRLWSDDWGAMVVQTPLYQLVGQAAESR